MKNKLTDQELLQVQKAKANNEHVVPELEDKIQSIVRESVLNPTEDDICCEFFSSGHYQYQRMSKQSCDAIGGKATSSDKCGNVNIDKVAIGDKIYTIDGDRYKETDINFNDGNCNGNACGYIDFRSNGRYGWYFTNRHTTNNIEIIPVMAYGFQCIRQQGRTVAPGATIEVSFPVPNVGYCAMCLPFTANFK